MLFNTLEFAIFFVIVYTLYLVLDHKWQNRMLLVGSCIFYGAWDWRFLLLMFVSITTDFFCARYIYESSDARARKKILVLNFIVNLGILGFFKYFNFFTESLQSLLHVFGFSIKANFLHIILPVGISFYTFQAMSYAFDVYRKQLTPAKNFLDYALFVTYFPQLVAGPIERANHLLPQVLKPRQLTLEKFYEGCYLIFWGLFLKVFVADNLAKIADPLFASGGPYSSIGVLIALYAFAFQIYGDFAGYSNIARGLGKCMGFDIMVNFNLPYFATNPSDFWKRWHISLSSWLRDYLYIPLGGNKNGNFNTYRNLGITMLLGGLWHGATWLFVLWGAYQGLLLIIYKLLKPFLSAIKDIRNSLLAKIWFWVRVILFFHITCLGWLIFRVRSIPQLFQMGRSLFYQFDFSLDADLKNNASRIMFFICILLIVQLRQYYKNDLLVVLKDNSLFKGVFYFVIFYLLLMFGVEGGKEFIYFQF
ncbi:MAG: MBOAT family O-acyltransferase [Candidatus Omnitrophota bacterium]